MVDVARTTGTQEQKGHRSAAELLESPEFKQLVARRYRVSAVLLVLLFIVYYGYILLIPYASSLMKMKIGEVTTFAIPLGVAVIVAAFVLTAVYVLWANSSYDPEVARLKGHLRK